MISFVLNYQHPSRYISSECCSNQEWILFHNVVFHKLLHKYLFVSSCCLNVYAGDIERHVLYEMLQSEFHHTNSEMFFYSCWKPWRNPSQIASNTYLIGTEKEQWTRNDDILLNLLKTLNAAAWESSFMRKISRSQLSTNAMVRTTFCLNNNST